MGRERLVGAAVLIALPVVVAAAGCATTGTDPVLERAVGTVPTTVVPASSPESTASTTVPTTVAAPVPTTTVPLPAGPPVAAGDPAGLATQIVLTERAIRDPATPPDRLAAMGHLQQVAYRKLGVTPEWDGAVLGAVPAELHQAVLANVAARREFRAMHTRLSDHVPAWRIVQPPPPEQLLAHYQEAEAVFGVEWEYLAAINLVETGMGRIRGVSSAGAQGPMQFLPSTWAAFGQGDINDPRDAIMAAARYLAHNGAPANMDSAIWNYNHSDRYVAGVKHYASVMQADPRTFHGFYHWQIYYLTAAGDVLLPVGYDQPQRVPVADYLTAHPQPTG